MEWMDKYRLAGGWLWVVGGLVVQGVAMASSAPEPGPITWGLIAVIVALAVALAVARDLIVTIVLGWATAIFFAADFAGAVADRFGAFGSPGTDGVSWGSWSAFIDYTATMLHFDGFLASSAAVGSTVVELTLGLLLLTGWQRRWVAKSTAGLFLAYTVLMGFSDVRDGVILYAMPVLVGGALLLSATPVRRSARVASESGRAFAAGRR